MRAQHESEQSLWLLRFFRLVTTADARVMTAAIEITTGAETETGTTTTTVDEVDGDTLVVELDGLTM